MPDIADAVVDMTETGSALRAAGLKVIETLLVSHTELIANPAAAADSEKRHAMEQILTLLQGTLEARGKVLVKLNVSAENLDAVLGVLPSMRAPTISELSGGGAYALETVVAKSGINTLIPALRDQGATDILELPLSKIVHLRMAGPLPAAGPHLGRVASFDRARGLGRVAESDGTEYAFHATAIADGSRDIEVDAAVVFDRHPGPPGPVRGPGADAHRVRLAVLPNSVGEAAVGPGARVASSEQLERRAHGSSRSPVAKRSRSRPRTTARPRRACTRTAAGSASRPATRAVATFRSSQRATSPSRRGRSAASPWRARP